MSAIVNNFERKSTISQYTFSTLGTIHFLFLQ